MPTFGVMDGEVVDVPSLQAPGFIKAAADGAFPDAASASAGALELEVRSTTPQYAGFRVSLAAGAVAPPYSCAGGGSIPLSRGCYKAKFSVPAGDGWHAVSVPFASFSDLWSPATGEHTKECSEDASACLTAKKLALPRCGQDAGVVHSIRGPRTRGAHTARPRALHDPSWHTA
jgi:hypothetical protein